MFTADDLVTAIRSPETANVVWSIHYVDGNNEDFYYDSRDGSIVMKDGWLDKEYVPSFIHDLTKNRKVLTISTRQDSIVVNNGRGTFVLNAVELRKVLDRVDKLPSYSFSKI